MPPYSGMKLIHDQMIEESLERRRYYASQETHRQGVLKTFGKVLARFTMHPSQKPAKSLPFERTHYQTSIPHQARLLRDGVNASVRKRAFPLDEMSIEQMS